MKRFITSFAFVLGCSALIVNAQETKKCPHQFIEFAQARICGGIGRGQKVIRAGGFDVAADLCQRGVSPTAFRSERTNEPLSS